MYPDLSLRENVTHGTRECPLRTMHFQAGEGTPYPDHFFVKRHWHEYVEFILITKGTYLFEINLENQILEEGDICMLNSGEPHEITGQGRAAMHEVVLFDPRILDFSYGDQWQQEYMEPFLKKALVIQNVLHPRQKGYGEIRSAFERLMDRGLSRESGWYISCKLSLLEIFYKFTEHQLFFPAGDVISPSSSRKIKRYKEIVSFMEEHYQDSLSLPQLGEQFGCNSQYLCRFFREIAGVSPVQYLIGYRIERACQLLERSSQPVTDVALECGFENISYFIRKFRELRGCTPSEYRKAGDHGRHSPRTPIAEAKNISQ
ncbi:MAG: AraC family transcriptional regulator [Lachnospiraceae bacterium]|nr:AraC family transcriptional regulator [Lachnospiraceae bacterium]